MLEDKNSTLIAFGLHVKTLRISTGLTQVEVSSAMGKDQQSLQRVESGRVNPSLYYLFELSVALNVDLSILTAFNSIAK